MVTVILAGGKASRFGSDKLTVKINGKSLLQHIADTCRPFSSDVWLSGRPAENLNGVTKSLSDSTEKSGPLSGIYSILSEPFSTDLFIVAGDYPQLSAEGLNWFFAACKKSESICIPETTDGFKHVLHSFLPLPLVEQLRPLQSDYKRQSVIGFFEMVPVSFIPVPDNLNSHFFNMNYKNDYHSITQ